MSTSIEKVAELALALTRDERAALADRLVMSLDPAGDEWLLRSWSSEAKRRLDELRSGTVEPIPAETVFAEIRELLK